MDENLEVSQDEILDELLNKILDGSLDEVLNKILDGVWMEACMSFCTEARKGSKRFRQDPERDLNRD